MASENVEPPCAEGESLERTRLLIGEAVKNSEVFCKTSSDLKKTPVQKKEGDPALPKAELFDLLQKCIKSPEFFSKLESVRALKLLSDGEEPQPAKELSEEEKELESYEVITKDDAVNAVVAAIVENVMECPEAANFSHQELQNAVANTCEALKQGRVRRYWEWGKWVYRVCAVGTGVFQAFTHPWIAKAIMMGIWQVPKFLLGLFF